MNDSAVNDLGATLRPRTGEQAGTRTLVLLLVICLLGIAGGAYWLYYTARRSPAGADGQTSGTPVASLLSDSTRAVLGRLESPVEIRFYALLDAATVPDSVIAFAGRVSRLLSAYQQEAGGKIKFTSVDALSNPNANAALADGISVFNQDKGEACYLGVALVLNGRKETLSHLWPEWEQALEPDLTRAILRLLDAPRSIISAPATVSQINTNTIQEVKALIPDIAAVSVQAGKQILQDAAYKDFTAAAKEMQAQLKEAEQRFTQSQNGGTAAEQEAAREHLAQVQAETTEKLKEVAARSSARIEAFQQLKAAPH